MSSTAVWVTVRALMWAGLAQMRQWRSTATVAVWPVVRSGQRNSAVM